MACPQCIAQCHGGAGGIVFYGREGLLHASLSFYKGTQPRLIEFSIAHQLRVAHRDDLSCSDLNYA